MQTLQIHRYVASPFKSKAYQSMGVDFINDEENQTVYTEDEGPVRIQYKCLVPIYVSPEMKLVSLFPKQNYDVLSPNFHIHVSDERFIYSQENRSAYFAAAK
jgi:hypothetical protein